MYFSTPEMMCSCVESLTDTVPSRALQQEASFTDALEAAVVIDAHPVQTDVPDLALVHIWAHTHTEQMMKHTHTASLSESVN